MQLRYGAIPYELTHSGARWITVPTSLFLHATLLQLLASMLFLAIFGPTLEDRLGPIRFLALYLLGGLFVLGLRVLIDPNTTVPVLGSAGAITAVLLGYIVLYPRARVISLVVMVFFFTIVEVPAVLLLGLWFALQICFGLTGPTYA